MSLPTYFSLSEAATYIGEIDSLPCTVDWVLQFARDGRLKLFFRPRGWYIAGTPNDPEAMRYYKSGQEYELDGAWAAHFGPVTGDVRSIMVPTLPNGRGELCFVLKAQTEVRTSMELSETDLFVRSKDLVDFKFQQKAQLVSDEMAFQTPPLVPNEKSVTYVDSQA